MQLFKGIYYSNDNIESSLTRSPRPSKVFYRVGQVVRHKILGYHGVIIGWDETIKSEQVSSFLYYEFLNTTAAIHGFYNRNLKCFGFEKNYSF